MPRAPTTGRCARLVKARHLHVQQLDLSRGRDQTRRGRGLDRIRCRRLGDGCRHRGSLRGVRLRKSDGVFERRGVLRKRDQANPSAPATCCARHVPPTTTARKLPVAWPVRRIASTAVLLLGASCRSRLGPGRLLTSPTRPDASSTAVVTADNAQGLDYSSQRQHRACERLRAVNTRCAASRGLSEVARVITPAAVARSHARGALSARARGANDDAAVRALTGHDQPASRAPGAALARSNAALPQPQQRPREQR